MSFLDFKQKRQEQVVPVNSFASFKQQRAGAFDRSTFTQKIIEAENRGARDRGENMYAVKGVTGDLGKYQVSPQTLATWSGPWLGNTYTPEEFLADPEAQEEFFSQFVSVAERLNLSQDEAAIAWHRGWGELGSGESRETRDRVFRESLTKRMQEPVSQEYLRKFNSATPQQAPARARARDMSQDELRAPQEKQGFDRFMDFSGLVEGVRNIPVVGEILAGTGRYDRERRELQPGISKVQQVGRSIFADLQEQGLPGFLFEYVRRSTNPNAYDIAKMADERAEALENKGVERSRAFQVAVEDVLKTDKTLELTQEEQATLNNAAAFEKVFAVLEGLDVTGLMGRVGNVVIRNLPKLAKAGDVAEVSRVLREDMGIADEVVQSMDLERIAKETDARQIDNYLQETFENQVRVNDVTPDEIFTATPARAADEATTESITAADDVFVASDATEEMRILSEDAQNLRDAVAFTADALADMPGRSLMRYVKRGENRGDFLLPELRSFTSSESVGARGQRLVDTRSRFEREGDLITMEIAGEASQQGDVAVAQQMIDEYINARSMLADLKESYKEARKAKADAAALERFSQAEARITDRLRALDEKYPGLGKIVSEKSTVEGTATAAYRLGAKQERKLARELIASAKKQTAARVENIAGTSKARAVRREQLKSLRQNIEIRSKKDAIIDLLQNRAESATRVRNLITDFAKDALSPSQRGKAMTIVKDAKNVRDLTKAFARINRWAEEERKLDLRNQVLKLQKKIVNSPTVAIDYKGRLTELLEGLDFKGRRVTTLERLKKTREFLDREAKKGNNVEVPRQIMKSLQLLERTPFDQITLTQMKGLLSEMELIETMGRAKFQTYERLWQIKKEKILDEIAVQAAPPISQVEILRPQVGERLTKTAKLKNLVWNVQNRLARIDRVISPMDTVFDTLDGGTGTYAGANFRFFKGQIDAGYGRYISRKDSIQEPVWKKANEYKLNDRNFERMGVVAAREQNGGTEKLLGSGFSQSEIDSVVLTSQEQEVLDLMRSTMDSQFPEIQDTMRKVYNQSVKKVNNYFSFMTDWKAMDDSEVFERFGAQDPEQFGAPRKNVEAGFTKARVGGSQKIKINALDVFLQHTDNTSYLLELGETTKMLAEVAASPKYAQLVGDAGQLLVREWLDVIARKGGASGAQQIRILDTLRQNVGAGILGLKLSTVAIQPTALFDGAGFIGTKYALQGVTDFAASREWRKFVAEMPEIKDRVGGEFALREMTDDGWLQEIQRKGFVPMQVMDLLTAGSIAAGAYRRKMVELGKEIDLTKGYDPEALAYAQLAVRRTQSSGSFKDVPLAISRGAVTGNRSLDRAIFQFQNFLLTRWSRIRHDAVRAGINTNDPKKAIPVLSSIMLASIAGSGIRYGVNGIQDMLTGIEEDDDITQELQKGFFYEMVGSVPFLGNVMSMAIYDGEMFPVLDAPVGLVKGLTKTFSSKEESTKLRGLTETAGSLGSLLGIPGSLQAETLGRRLIRGAESSGGAPSGGEEIDFGFDFGLEEGAAIDFGFDDLTD